MENVISKVANEAEAAVDLLHTLCEGEVGIIVQQGQYILFSISDHLHYANYGILDRCFKKYHPLRKVINRNTVKLGYKCMPNMKKQISRHNHRVLNPTNQQVAPPECNCRNPPCPLNGACMHIK